MQSKLIKNSLTALIMMTTLPVAVTSYADGLCGVDKTVFSCKTRHNKIIKVCQSGNLITYSYGRKGKTELKIGMMEYNVQKSPWNGMGHSMNQSVGFKRGKTVYNVYSSYERRKNGRGHGGVLVEHKGKDTDISCKKHTITDRLIEFTQE